MNVYEAIGPDKLWKIIYSFYQKSFADPMLAHFFWNHDLDRLAKMQLAFVTSMLGGPAAYSGQSLAQAHAALTIRMPHFQRRQKLLQETMDEEGLAPRLAKAWLAQEERLKPLIINGAQSCLEHPDPSKPRS